FCFFFSSRRRHTRFSRDWSSDVCSSDLRAARAFERHDQRRLARQRARRARAQGARQRQRAIQAHRDVDGRRGQRQAHARERDGEAGKTGLEPPYGTCRQRYGFWRELMREPRMADAAPPLHFTDAAARKVGQLIAEEGNAALKLRVYVQGGGCSGFQYGFTFDEEVQEGDRAIENEGVTLLVAPMSVQYLMGAEIDFREDLSGAQFIIRNPNATTTCGCGSSFTV